MNEPLSFAPVYRHVLLVAAAPAEVAAVAAAFNHVGPPDEWRRIDVLEGWSLVRSGVGKVNAGLCVSRCLAEGAEPGTLVINVGVCGALPRAEGVLANRTVVVGSASVYGDEGVAAGSGFTDMASLGFGYWPGASDAMPGGCSGVAADATLVEGATAQLRREFAENMAVGPIATISTCSGTDGLAKDVATRTGAIAEAMEGAAIAHALTRTRVGGSGFLELRVVSNPTGERSQQNWDLQGALATLTRVIASLRSKAAE